MPATLPRREFLLAAATLPIAAATSALRADESRVPVVDTHLHCFAGKDDKRFPYHERAPYQPAEAATPEHLLECMAGAKVDYAVVVHPEPYQDDHQYLEHCLKVGRGRLKGTLLLLADRPGSLEQLPDLKKRLAVVAVRVHAYAPDRLPPFGKPELRNLWKQAADHGLAVQLHFEPRYAPGFEPLIREFAKTTVIIDHLGRPLQGTPDEYKTVAGWSKLKNTVMKISSLPSTRTYPHRDVGPIVKQLIEAFGPDRLIYGGGYGPGATGESYRAEIERTRSFLTSLTAAQQAQVLGGNAAKLFGFGS